MNDVFKYYEQFKQTMQMLSESTGKKHNTNLVHNGDIIVFEDRNMNLVYTVFALERVRCRKALDELLKEVEFELNDLYDEAHKNGYEKGRVDVFSSRLPFYLDY